MQSRPVHGNIELQEYLPLLVDISLYGANEDTYYKVTGIHGAFNRVLMNCKKLKEAGIRVALKTPVLNETLGQIDEMKSIATKMGIPFVYTFEICPTIDKDVSPKSHQVNMVDALRYEFENHFEQVKNFEKSDLDRNNIIQELLNNDHVYRCNVALNCFDSLQELEEEINSRNDMLNRLKDRSALLEELRKESGSDDVARELYICYAIETELNRMNYEIADKISAETIVGKKLENYRLKDKLLQYYEHGGNSMMQLFKVSDNVGLQLIVHSDGTSTMETISLNGTENENVVKIQKEHCERTRKLKEVLKRNWDIEIELEEKASADHVAFEFETIRQKVDKTNSYMEVRRKKAIEKRRKNAEKKKERSIALR